MNAQKFYEILLHANKSLTENKEYVNSLNVFPVPDGDTGTNMAATFNEAVTSITFKTNSTIEEIATQLSKGALMGARGNSGVILSQILRGFAKGLSGCHDITVDSCKAAMMSAKESSYKAVLKPKEGTILSVIRAASESAEKNAEISDLTEYFDTILSDTKDMLEETRNMLPANKSANTVDAGGAGLVIILQAFSDVLNGRATTEFNFNKTDLNIEFDFVDEHPTGDDIQFQYCTEFIIKAGVNEDDFRETLSKIGDCVVVVSMDDITKVHVHTNEPGTALNKAVKFGDLTKIKIDNMKEQSDNNTYRNNIKEEVKTERVNQAFIAVSSGEGLKEVFIDAGASYVISGGQSMNPSVEDIIKAINSVNADNVIILPNNKNIILSAEQAASIVDCNVQVVKTTTMPQGITAAISYDINSTPQENYDTMSEVIESVTTCEVTTAVKDTVMNGLNITAGEFLGIKEHNIITNGTNSLLVLENMLKEAVTEDSTLVTIIYGSDISEEQLTAVSDLIKKLYTDIDICLINGKQDIYPFILGIE